MLSEVEESVSLDCHLSSDLTELDDAVRAVRYQTKSGDAQLVSHRQDRLQQKHILAQFLWLSKCEQSDIRLGLVILNL